MNTTALGIPNDLSEYLATLVTPFHVDGKMLVVPVGGVDDWSLLEDASYHAALLVGDPAEYIDELWRVLKPGAHVLAVAPEDQPTGHTGAITLEDKGFEIRDAILWVDEPGQYHYVPKPSQRERHAGCEHLKIQKKVQQELDELESEQEIDELESEQEIDELESEQEIDELESEQEIDKVVKAEDPIDLHTHKGNVHPTVKARAIMAKLLEDVPKTATVLDPFMGSGSTALACLETGHNFIGIEKEAEYLEISTTRVKHHDRANVGDGATIESEYKPPVKNEESEDLFDFFDL